MNNWQKTMYGGFSAQLHLNSPASHQKARKEARFFIKTLGLKKDQLILDIPCGVGRHTLALAKKGFSVVGVDINESSLKKS